MEIYEIVNAIKAGKTFEMAMILKNYGASVEAVSEFYKEEYEEMNYEEYIIDKEEWKRKTYQKLKSRRDRTATA